MSKTVDDFFQEAMAKGSLMTYLKKDVYKESHIAQLGKNVEELLETWTPRGTRIEGVNSIILFNLQAFTMEYLIEDFNKTFFNVPLDDIIAEYKMFMNGVLFDDDPDLEAIISLHNLGYLPIEIKAVKEGTRVPMRCPAFTFRSTIAKFAWLAGSLETLTSTENWSPITVATIAAEMNRVTREFALKTTGSYDGTEYMNHDFSMRGMSGVCHAASAGAGHCLSGKGTDTIPAVHRLWKYYDGKIAYGGIGCSVPATEHMVMCVGMDKNRSEKAILKRLLTETYPNGILSAVLDADDFWHNIMVVLPELKKEIMARDGKFVCRPDSGNPADIICGTDRSVTGVTPEEKGLVQVLYEEWGGTMSDTGYKLLDSHIGAIYGDSITMAVQRDIYERLAAKGFSSMNVVLGIGSFQYNMNTRDTFNQAFKAVNSVVDGVDVPLFKDPKTDTAGIKKSQRGRVVVFRNDAGEIDYIDGLTKEEVDNMEDINLLETVFFNGKLMRFQTHEEIVDIVMSEI